MAYLDHTAIEVENFSKEIVITVLIPRENIAEFSKDLREELPNLTPSSYARVMLAMMIGFADAATDE